MPDDNMDDQQETPAESTAAEKAPAEKHPIKKGFRDAVGEVAGLAVELGSILGGEGGDLVKAEREMTEHNTEEFIDRIDGEG